MTYADYTRNLEQTIYALIEEKNSYYQLASERCEEIKRLKEKIESLVGTIKNLDMILSDWRDLAISRGEEIIELSRKISNQVEEKPKFKVGDIVEYIDNEIALIQVLGFCYGIHKKTPYKVVALYEDIETRDGGQWISICVPGLCNNLMIEGYKFKKIEEKND